VPARGERLKRLSRRWLSVLQREMSSDIKLGGFTNRSDAVVEDAVSSSEDEGEDGSKTRASKAAASDRDDHSDEDFDPATDVAVDDDPAKLQAEEAAKGACVALVFVSRVSLVGLFVLTRRVVCVQRGRKPRAIRRRGTAEARWPTA
jgi:hypothetical protein